MKLSSTERRLIELEKTMVTRQSGRATVIYGDGSEARLPLEDVILLLAKEPMPVDVIGGDGKDTGQLAALIRGLLFEPCKLEKGAT